jgi:XTP/dITP diphosphohydrolase
MEFLIATKNFGKIIEMKQLLSALPIRLRDLSEFPEASDVEETGSTFSENAVLKASAYAIQTGIWSLADDSGLEVKALGGAPGVFSARYAGENSTDNEKISKLLDEIGQIDNAPRTARFVCAVAIADESGQIKFQAAGSCSGMIALARHGNHGFGYDPIFIPDGFDQTFGELSPEIKQQISHRSAAIGKIIGFLRDFTAP